MTDFKTCITKKLGYKYPDTAIIVFCKAPIAGQVKTRLMPSLSAEQAVEAHKTLTHHVLSSLSKYQLCHIQFWCSPDTRHSFFSQCAQRYDVSLHQQQGQDLGERMHHAISCALASSSKVLLIGTDCPSLTIEDFEVAINGLNKENDILFSPAEDGGYVMVGMIKPQPLVFLNMTWGHENVFNNSQSRATQAGLNLIQTRQHWDVDTFSDWQRFMKESAQRFLTTKNKINSRTKF